MKKHRLTFLFFLFLALSFQSLIFAQPKKNSCLECHNQLEEKLAAPARSFSRDIHANYGLLCSDCHGGNPAADDIEEAKDKTFRGIPSRQQIPQLCASCHSNASYMKNYNPRLRVDQLDLYLTSQHGVAFKKGDLKVAICTDCHGVHGIQSASMPQATTFAWNIAATCGRCHSDANLMKGYGFSSQQEQDYRASIHARALYEKKDLSAPTCNDCHGNHGASPPEVVSIANVCRQCHPSASELFARSPHKAAFDEAGISECEACHGHHRIQPPSDDMLAGGKEDTCAQCHDSGTETFQKSLRLGEELRQFAGLISTVSNRLEVVARKGVEVSEARYQLQGAWTALFEARNLIHGLSFSEIRSRLKEGTEVANRVNELASLAEKEARFRKTGLVVSTIFLFLLATALLLKARAIRKHRFGEPNH